VLYHHQIILAGSSSYQDLKAAGRLNISDHSVYEADTDYLHPEVAALAALMRGITNHIFDYMADTWQQSAIKDPEMVARYAAINTILVDAFEDALAHPKSLVQRDVLLSQACNQIDNITVS
ncbi:MAG: B12-binding domain-containing radical SAM protein, partial [Eubacterium sp.]